MALVQETLGEQLTMLMKCARLSFKEWMNTVNALTLANHHMSIYELEDEIPREVWVQAHTQGMEPRLFVDAEVTPVFYPERYTEKT